MRVRWFVGIAGVALIAVGLFLAFKPGLVASAGGAIGAGLLAVLGAALAQPHADHESGVIYRQEP